MINDQLALQQAERYAFETLAKGVRIGDSVIKPAIENITTPAMIMQETPFVNTQNTFTFEYGNQAPTGTATLNNIVLGNNNSFVMYGIQFLIGNGANANNRIYTSTGITQNDNSIYNGQLSLSLESNVPVQKMDMFSFFEQTPNIQYPGLVLIQPNRVLTGKLSKFQVTIALPNSISALALTPNLFLSCRLWGALGLA